jgi:hypothetical protein
MTDPLHNFEFPEGLQEEDDDSDPRTRAIAWAIVFGLGFVFWGSVAAAMWL